MTEKTVTLEAALKQLALPALPRTLGKTKDGAEIIASSGPFGPYLKAGKYNIQLKNADPYTITFAEAEKLYQEKMDSIIADWGDIMIIVGAYGPYVKGPGRFNNVKIPKDQDPKKITLEEAKKCLTKSQKGVVNSRVKPAKPMQLKLQLRKLARRRLKNPPSLQSKSNFSYHILASIKTLCQKFLRNDRIVL